MNFHLSTEALIGTALILWGISIFVKLIWGIDIPVLKPLLAIFLIYWGFVLLFGKPKLYSSYSARTFYTYPVEENEENIRK